MNRVFFSLFIMIFLMHFVASGQSVPVKNRIMVIGNKGFISADTLLEKFNFYYTNFYTVAGMQHVPLPVKAIASKDFYMDENNLQQYAPGVICLSLMPDSDTLTNIKIEEKVSGRAVYISGLDFAKGNEYIILQVPFKNGVFSSVDISYMDLRDNSSFYLNNGLLTKRGIFFQEVPENSKVLQESYHAMDTLCDNVRYPAYKACVTIRNDTVTTSDSLFFTIRMKVPGRSSKLKVHHHISYVPPDGLDMEPQIEIVFSFTGKRTRKEIYKTYFVAIPPVWKRGNYWLTIAQTMNSAPKEIKAHPVSMGCPMIVEIQ